MGEGNADAVGTEGPVEGVRGWSEVCKEGDGVGKGWEFGEGDGRKAVVVERTSCNVWTVSERVDTAAILAYFGQ